MKRSLKETYLDVIVLKDGYKTRTHVALGASVAGHAAAARALAVRLVAGYAVRAVAASVTCHAVSAVQTL